MARQNIEPAETGETRDQQGQHASIDPAMAALLDHIAEDLAGEYVRLMEKAAQSGRAPASSR